MNNFEQQLKQLIQQLNRQPEGKPSSAWLKSTRSQIQQQVRASQGPAVSGKKSTRTSWWAGLFLTPARVVATVLIAVLVLSGGTALAAQGAAPGEPLYPLKLAGENFNILIQVSPKAKAELHLKYADRRLGELEKIYEKQPDSDYWQEQVVDSMSQQMIGAKDALVSLREQPEYAEIALQFEQLTDDHNQRLADLEERLNTTTIIIINRAQGLAEQNRERALEALQEAQTMMEHLQQQHELLQRRLQARLELLQARQAFINDQLDEQLDLLEAEPNSVQLFIEPSSTNVQATTSDLRTYENDVDEDGVHFDSKLEIESDGSEDVDTDIDINNGQVIINSQVRGTGTSIYLRDLHRIEASSKQHIRINGEEVELE